MIGSATGLESGSPDALGKQLPGMSPTLRVLINAAVLASLFVMQNLTYTFGFSRLLAFYAGLGLALYVANRDQLRGSQSLTRAASRLLLWFALAFITMHIVRESIDYAAFVDDTRNGIKLGLVETATALTLFLVGWAYRNDGIEMFLVTVAIAIGGYVGLNLFLEITGWLPGPIEEGFRSRYEEGLRWMPPVAKSNGLFSILNRYAVSVALLCLVFCRKNLSWLIRLALLVTLIAGTYAAVLLEHRAAILPVFVAPLVYGLAKSKGRAVLPWFCLSAMVAVPIALGSGWWERNTESLVPDFVFRLSGDPTTVSTMSGRDNIYAYGLEYAINSQMGFFGDGPVFRDSLPGFNDASRTAYLESLKTGSAPQTFGFHNGFLDVVIAYGSACAALFLAFLATAVVLLTKSESFRLQTARLGLTNLAVLLSVNVFDGGFSDFNILFLTLIGASLAVACVSNQISQHPYTIPSSRGRVFAGRSDLPANARQLRAATSDQ